MLLDLAIRFALGGLIVCIFAVIGEVLSPKSFAGIFGAAPSVALASLGLTFIVKGGKPATVDGQAMVLGAVALCGYCAVVTLLVLRYRWDVKVATGVSWAVWLAVAFGLRAFALA